jgi:hypothetical protein
MVLRPVVLVACVMACDAGETVTSSPVIELPAHPPLIEVSASGGFGGGFIGRTSVWWDGSVLSEQRDQKPRRSKVRPEVILHLYARLERSGVFERDPTDVKSCERDLDGVRHSLSIRRGATKFVFRDESHCPDWVVAAIRDVWVAVYPRERR